ncbi:MAG: hypothetical protein RL104_714, partial [Bacteroidota bacterium]
RVIGEVTVALLGAEQEEGRVAQRERSAATQGERGGVGAGAPDEAAVPVLELAGDPLEADQRLDAAYAVAGAEGGDERRGHERLDHRGVRRAGFG